VAERGDMGAPGGTARKFVYKLNLKTFETVLIDRPVLFRMEEYLNQIKF
jgi:hypothetical protein